jgi:hypothetical protein
MWFIVIQLSAPPSKSSEAGDWIRLPGWPTVTYAENDRAFEETNKYDLSTVRRAAFLGENRASIVSPSVKRPERGGRNRRNDGRILKRAAVRSAMRVLKQTQTFPEKVLSRVPAAPGISSHCSDNVCSEGRAPRVAK